MRPASVLRFTKMQGIGNDFVVIDDFGKSAAQWTPLNADRARRICDRRFGIGADQILWIKDPQGAHADARMEILNADGSEAEMCGNGIRAVALYLHDHSSLKGKTLFQVETLAGLIPVKVEGREVEVAMGVPVLGGGFPREGELLRVVGREIRFFEVGMGNPHAVIFVEDASTAPVEELGPEIEKHPRFPKRTNVEFVEVDGPGSIRVRVWERGAGVTLACGTGASASAVATLATGRAKGELRVSLPGGDLRLGWEGPGKPVMMRGPAEEVFHGEIELE